jgi:hypothetical protein
MEQLSVMADLDLGDNCTFGMNSDQNVEVEERERVSYSPLNRI